MSNIASRSSGLLRAIRKCASVQISRTFYAAICGVFSSIATYTSGAIAARALGPAAIGEFYIAIQIVSYLTLAAGLGLTEIAQREVARHPILKNRILWLVVAIQLPLSVFFFLGSILLNAYLGYIEQRLWFIVACIAIANSINIAWFLQANKHTTFSFVATLISDIALAISCISFVHYPEDIYIYAILYVLFQIIKVILFILYASVYKIGIGIPNFSLRGSRSLIMAAAPNSISYASILIYYNSDAFVINHYFDEATVGKYTAAYSLMLILTAPCFAVLKVHFSLIAEVARGSNAIRVERSRVFLRTLTYIGAPLAAFGMLFAEDIFSNVYGERFGNGWVYFQYLSVNMLMIYINVGYAKPLIAWGYQKAHMFITISSALVNLALNFCLIPQFGALGAVYATIVAELFVFFAVWWVRTSYHLARFNFVRAVGLPILCSFFLAYLAKVAWSSFV